MFSFDVFETYLFLSRATVFKVIYHVDKIIDKKMKYKNCSITTTCWNGFPFAIWERTCWHHSDRRERKTIVALVSSSSCTFQNCCFRFNYFINEKKKGKMSEVHSYFHNSYSKIKTTSYNGRNIFLNIWMMFTSIEIEKLWKVLKLNFSPMIQVHTIFCILGWL